MQCIDTHVALCAQPSYPCQGLEVAVEGLLKPVFSLRNCRSARILLKPNLITATNGRLACTNGAVILAAARWFVDQGARVSVGDSPAFGSAQSVLRKIGILSELRQMGVEIAEFRRHAAVCLPGGEKAHIALPALECDVLINLPKVKAHSQMRVTLAVKNYFGCIAGLHKPWWHMVHGGARGRFADLLVELPAVLPNGYSIVDGVEAMHETGPVHGQPYALGVLAGGENPFAVDTGLLALLGVDPRQCPLWLTARKAGIPGTDPGQLVYTQANPEELRAKGFRVPGELTPVRFNPVRFVKSTLQRMLMAS